MRRAAFDTTPVKEIAVVAPDGQTLCTHLGLPLGQRKVVSSEPLFGAPGYALDIIALEGGQQMVRLRRKTGEGVNGVAALVPAILFLPQVATQGGPFSAYAHIASHGGAVIGQLGKRPQGSGTAVFVANDKSSKFGFDVEVSAPRASVIAGGMDLKWLGIFATGAVVMVLGVFVHADAAAHGRQSGGRDRARLRGGRVHSLLPAHRRYPLRPIARRRSAGALAKAERHAGAAGLVHPAGGIERADPRNDARPDAPGLRRGRRRHRLPPGLKISFNFAGQLFSDDSIVKDVRKIFSGSPIKLSQVVLEVTERDPIENFTATRQTIAALQGLGVRIAIDDVGTGHSGLSYMLKLGVDIIKIDKMFVDAIGTDRNSTTIVETLVDLAHNMRMDVVAEGVENFEQVMHLRELGIRSAQGYVFAPPLPGSAFLQLIEAIDPLPAAASQPADVAVDPINTVLSPI